MRAAAHQTPACDSALRREKRRLGCPKSACNATIRALAGRHDCRRAGRIPAKAGACARPSSRCLGEGGAPGTGPACFKVGVHALACPLDKLKLELQRVPISIGKAGAPSVMPCPKKRRRAARTPRRFAKLNTPGSRVSVWSAVTSAPLSRGQRLSLVRRGIVRTKRRSTRRTRRWRADR